MAEQNSPQTIPDVPSTTLTVVTELDAQEVTDVPTVTLRLRKPKNDKKVQWTGETVDNEDMNKKKSKCCCIYHKPKRFEDGSSSSSDDSDDECEHCHGHVEKRKHRKKDSVECEHTNNHQEVSNNTNIPELVPDEIQVEGPRD